MEPPDQVMTDPLAPLADDFRIEPWWWKAAPRPDEEAPALPARADVVIIGSGYTGCSAAATLAAGGRDVLALDADVPGYGASSRNAGFVGRTFKRSVGELAGNLGRNRAIAVYDELAAAFGFVERLIADEPIACHYARCGRFLAALSWSQYETMARDLETKRELLGDEFEMVPFSGRHRELGSDRHVGGAVIPDVGGIHPGLYHLGLLDRARRAGASVHGHTAVEGVRREHGGLEVYTSRGTVRARDVVIATNGYTGAATPWHRRRVVAFAGYMIATERLSEEAISTVFPNRRTYHDYNHNIDFMRPAPDEPRILFGGLTGTVTSDLPAMAGRLRDKLVSDCPDLAGVRVSRVWTGNCAGTFDMWPHIGTRDGIHYAMGYCYAGLPMGTWLGHKVGARILGAADAQTVFADRPFPSNPAYWGGMWPTRVMFAWYNFHDRRAGRRSRPTFDSAPVPAD